MKNVIKKKLLKVWSLFTRKSYRIGFLREDEVFLNDEVRSKRVKWLKMPHYNGGWFADPFVLNVHPNCIEVLAEEYKYELSRGILSHLMIDIIDGEFVLREVTPILQLDTHLSFPNYIIENNKIYVYPENYESGSLKIYEYETQSRKLINPRLMVEEPIVDSAIVKVGDVYYLFGTINDGTGLDTTKKVEVYKSGALFGPYTHTQTIINEYREERGAGSIYKDNQGNYVRPVQCCNSRYGESLKLKYLIFGEEGASEKEFYHMKPIAGMKNSLCLHTFNMLDSFVAIDGEDYIHPFFAKRIMPVLYGIFKKIWK